MKPLRFLMLVLFATFLCLAGCEKPSAEWKVFAPEGGGFSVLVPGEPQVESQKAKDGSEPRSYRIYPFLSNIRGMAVGYADQPVAGGGSKDPEAILNQSRDTSVADLKGKLESETRISLQGYPGRELKVTLPKNYVVRMRIYLAGSRKYSLMAVASAANYEAAEVRKFFDSFKITR